MIKTPGHPFIDDALAFSSEQSLREVVDRSGRTFLGPLGTQSGHKQKPFDDLKNEAECLGSSPRAQAARDGPTPPLPLLLLGALHLHSPHFAPLLGHPLQSSASCWSVQTAGYRPPWGITPLFT